MRTAFLPLLARRSASPGRGFRRRLARAAVTAGIASSAAGALAAPAVAAAGCTGAGPEVNVWVASQGLWSDGSGWSHGVVPGANTDVCVPADSLVTVTAAGARAASMHVAGELRIYGASASLMTGSTTLEGVDAIVVDGGTFSPQGSVSLDGADTTLRLLRGSFAPADGSVIAGEGSVELSPAASIGGTGELVLDATTRMRLEAGSHSIGMRALAVRGQLELVGGASVSGLGGDVHVQPGGQLTATGGGESLITVPVENDGTVATADSAILLGGSDAPGRLDDGVFVAHPGASVMTTNGSTHRIGNAVWVGTGTFRFASGTTTHLTGVASINFLTRVNVEGELRANSGYVGGAGTLALSDSSTLYGSLELDAGIMTTQFGAVHLADHANVLNRGTWSIACACELTGASSALLRNTGTLRSTGNGTATVGVAVDNDGVARAASGVLRLAGGGPGHSGSFQTAAGATVEFAGGTHVMAGAAISGSGTHTLGGGTLDLAGSTLTLAGVMRHSAGSVTGSGTIGGTGTWEWSGGSLGSGGNISTGTGLILRMTGARQLAPGTTLVNRGRLELGDGSTLGGAETTISNVGTLTMAAGSSTAPAATLGTALGNSGTVLVPPQGTIALTGSISNLAAGRLAGGTWRVQAGGVLRLPSSGPGINAATIELLGTGARMQTAQGGNALGLLSENQPTGTITLAGGASVTSHAPLRNDGAIAVRDGSDLGVGTDLEHAAGTLTIGTGSTVSIGGGAGTLGMTGGRLEGGGTIDGSVVQAAGTIAPSPSPATLAITGSLQQHAGAVLALRVNASSPDAHDRITVGSSARVDGTIALEAATYAASTGSFWGDELAVVTAAEGLAGAPAALTGAELAAPWRLRAGVHSGDGGRLVLAVTENDAPRWPAASPINSITHVIGQPAAARTVVASLAAADDADGSGIAGYAALWTSNADADPGTAITHGPGTTLITSPELADGHGHWLLVRAVDHAGNASDIARLGPFAIDATPPPAGIVVPHRMAAVSLQQRSTGTPTPQLTVAWPAAPDDDVAALRVEQRLTRTNGSVVTSAGTDAEGWQLLHGTSSPVAGRHTFAGRAGHEHCIRIVVIDAAGNSTAPPAAQTCTAVPTNDTSLAGRGWTRTRHDGHYLGTAARASRKGTALTLRNVRATRLTLVATRCSSCGTVRWYHGTRLLGTHDLWASSTRRRQLITRTVPAGTPAANVRVVITSSGRPVSVEGIAASR